MKYIFFVQGEGRGHLMQAITLKEQLEQRGHKVSAVFVSMSPAKKLPDFFETRMKLKITVISGPVFVSDKKGKGISFSQSLLANIRGLKNWPKSLRTIEKSVIENNPDALISFYEPLVSLYRLISFDRRPFFVIGHQFLAAHSNFIFPKNYFFQKKAFLFYNQLLSFGHPKKIALSFSQEPDEEKNNIFVCPPLIRPEIINAISEKSPYTMAYLLNQGYSEEIKNWCQNNLNQNVEAFCDHPELIKNLPLNLKFHPLNDHAFAECLRKCSNYISTAGFESICEASYLDKNIVMVPTKNHYEQLCNAYDAERAGLAVMSQDFNLNKLKQKDTQAIEKRKIFKTWVDSQQHRIINIIEGGE